MGRPKGSKNKPKDPNAAPRGSKENPHPTPQTNVSEGLYLAHIRKIAAAEKKKDEAVNALRAARKSAKGDGVDLKTMDALRHLSKLSETEVAQGFNTMVAYARWSKTPVWGQIDLFEVGEINDETVAAKARERGEAAGRNAQDQTTCPYAPGSAAGQEWLAGYNDGQAVLMQGFGELSAPQ